MHVLQASKCCNDLYLYKICIFLFQFDYSEPVVSSVQEEVKEPVDSGPRPWNEPKIPLQEQKSQRQKIDEAIGNIKVCCCHSTGLLGVEALRHLLV